MTQVLLTVDTALRWAAHAGGASWQANFASLDLPGKLGLLAEHGLKACFFVDPMPALVYGIEPIRQIVDAILGAGQEVQLHLHPVWQSVAEGVPEGARFELTCFDAEDQLDLIETARELLTEAGAPASVAFRSGGYKADVPTLAALLQAGLRFDSSHLPGRSALPLEADLAGPTDLGGVIELPVAFHLGAASGDEIEAALLERRSLLTLAADGFEAPDRFERLCAFLGSRADTLPTTHLADLRAGPSAAAGKPLPLRAWRATRRTVEQAWPKALRAGSM